MDLWRIEKASKSALLCILCIPKVYWRTFVKQTSLISFHSPCQDSRGPLAQDWSVEDGGSFYKSFRMYFMHTWGSAASFHLWLFCTIIWPNSDLFSDENLTNFWPIWYNHQIKYDYSSDSWWLLMTFKMFSGEKIPQKSSYKAKHWKSSSHEHTPPTKIQGENFDFDSRYPISGYGWNTCVYTWNIHIIWNTCATHLKMV